MGSFAGTLEDFRFLGPSAVVWYQLWCKRRGTTVLQQRQQEATGLEQDVPRFFTSSTVPSGTSGKIDATEADLEMFLPCR